MASSLWVVNASPLILLGKTGQIALLGNLNEQIVVPRAVVREIGAKPDGRVTIHAVTHSANFVLVDDEAASQDILSWDLGAGETQVIAHALAHGADRVVIDDLEARRCASSMGLGVIGTLGIVGRAKALGLVDQAEPVIRRLRETGLYISDDLVRRLLAEVGE